MSSPNSWFVQTGFGTVLGPMPDDALVEMVRTGALIASDLVRTDASAEWQQAGQVPGLFSDSPSLHESPSPVEKPGLSEAPCDHQPAEVFIHPSQRPIAPTETVAYAFDEPETQPATQEEDLVAQWKAERKQRSKRREDNPIARQIAREVDDSELEPIPDIFADEAVAEVLKPVSPSEPKVTDVAAPLEQRSTIQRPSFLSQIAPDRPAIPVESFTQKRDRWMRSLPSWPIMTAVILMMFSGWWFWPRSQRDTYDRFVVIWSELQHHRALPLDKSGMANFVERSESELNVIVQRLNKRASPKDHESSLLLKIGQDCLQPMLKRPRERDSLRERQLTICFRALAEIYGLPRTDLPIPSLNADSVDPVAMPDPEKATSNNVSEPLPEPLSNEATTNPTTDESKR